MIKVKSLLLSCLLTVSLFLTLTFNPSVAFAQDTEFSCASELGDYTAATFLNSECDKVVLTQPTIFYRYYSDSSNKYGRYLTTDDYNSNVEVITELALNQDWGNRATVQEKVILPAGTVIYQGVVAPQTPASCYPGGGEQVFIKNSKDPTIIWFDGHSMTLESFNCSLP